MKKEFNGQQIAQHTHKKPGDMENLGDRVGDRDNMRRSNVCSVVISEREERENWVETIFEKIMLENFPQLFKVLTSTETITPRTQRKPQPVTS